MVPDTLDVEYRWGVFILLLAACKVEPKGPVQIIEPEVMRFDTEHIRREVDVYKTERSPIAKRRMEKAFAAFDERVRGMEAEAGALADPAEREMMEHRIANLKMRRELHWTRSQTRNVETEVVRRAQPINERAEAFADRGGPEVRRAEPIAENPDAVAEQAEPVKPAKRRSTARSQRGTRDVEMRVAPRSGFWKLFSPRGGSTPPQLPARIPAR